MDETFKWNRKLLWWSAGIGTALIYRLFLAAVEQSNWRGFWYSTLHVVIVGFGVYFSLRKK
jgi:hypothetical protein